MNNKILYLLIILLFSSSISLDAANSLSSENNQAIKGSDIEWRIGGKIHFEEESGPDYIGIKEVNKVDVCSDNTKILLKREADEIQMTHYVEKSRPRVGEEMHATLLYTQARGFCNSETLNQICENLFERCDVPPSIENVAAKYGSIIKPEWKFKLAEVVLTKSASGSSFIMAKLLFEGHERLFKDNKPISAGLREL